MKAKKQLILWILVPLIVYTVLYVVTVVPMLSYDARKLDKTVSPITILSGFFFAIWLIPAYTGIFGIAVLAILSVAWLIGFSRLYEKYLQEKASIHARSFKE